MKLGSFINLSLSTNTKNSAALKYSDILEKKITLLVESSTNAAFEMGANRLPSLNYKCEQVRVSKEAIWKGINFEIININIMFSE